MFGNILAVAVTSVLLTASAGASASAAETLRKTPLKPFNVTIRVFDLAKGVVSGVDYVLPVDSPDAEHAAASTLANAASFTPKIDGGKPLPVAFTCTKVEPR